MNCKLNNWVQLSPIVEFAYNNSKNASMDHTPFKLNCGYYFWISYEEKVNLRSQSKLVDKLSEKLRKLMIIYCKKFHYAQKLQKRAHNKGVKPWRYVFSEKVWLNSKYIMIKRNRKLEAKFFEPFKVLYLVKKQVYKLELPRN